MQFFVEFESQAKKRHDVLQEQIEHWKQKAFKSAQDFDIYRAESSGKDSEFRGQLEDLEQKHDEEVARLNLRLNEKNLALDECASLGDRLRESQRENGEYHLRIKGLLAENDEIRSLKSEELVQHEQQVRLFRRQISDFDVTTKQLQTEKDSLKIKLERQEEELRVTLRRFDEVNNENTNLRLEVSKTKSGFEEATHQFKIEQGDFELLLMKERNTWSHEKVDLKSIIDSCQHHLEESKQHVADLSNKMLVKERQIVEAVQSAREEEWSKLRSVETEKRQLESSLANTTQSFHEAKVKIESDSKNLVRDLERYRAEVQELQQKLQNSLQRNEKIINENDEMRTSADELRKTIVEKEESFTRLQVEVYDGKLNLDRVVRHNEKIIAEGDEANSLAEEVRKELMERDELITRLNVKLEDENKVTQRTAEQVAGLQGMLKKLKHGYKKRMAELQATMEATLKESKKLETENHKLRKSLETDNHHSQLKLREMYRKQDDFLSFLKKEGIAKPASMV